MLVGWKVGEWKDALESKEVVDVKTSMRAASVGTVAWVARRGVAMSGAVLERGEDIGEEGGERRGVDDVKVGGEGVFKEGKRDRKSTRLLFFVEAVVLRWRREGMFRALSKGIRRRFFGSKMR